ncbi:MAG: hypothetical protein EXQ85_01570 [Alphaproteobacteria bacterium]|nr:hypothetical protein [Alphaproteobacteria bacterium]
MNRSAIVAITGLMVLLGHAPLAATEAPVHKFSATVAAASDYAFGGITQTGGEPAVQGSLDYAHKSGAYAGV